MGPGWSHLPCHVVAAFFQLNHSLAIVTPLPALFLGHLHQAIRFLVLWTLALGVEPLVAQYAYFCRACSATGISPSICQIHANPRRLNPLSTSFAWTVESICCGIFLVFLVPQNLELVVEQALSVLQWNVFGGATSWRHVLGILYRERKLALEA
jgi:hypothetical protein